MKKIQYQCSCGKTVTMTEEELVKNNMMADGMPIVPYVTCPYCGQLSATELAEMLDE